MKKATQRRGRAQVGVQNVDAKAIYEKHDEYRKYARSQVLSAWPQILEGLIEKAMGGGYQHTKLLLDLCQLATEEPSRADGRPKEQLCDALLDNLLLRRPE
jgi:hypothetical protein